MHLLGIKEFYVAMPAKRMKMKALNRHHKCTSAVVKKKMDEICNAEEREEYAGVILFYLNKKYEALVKQGT